MCDSTQYNLISEDSTYECAICLDVVEDELITLNKCKHQYHKSCIKCWYVKSNTCPLCRMEIIDIYRVSLQKDFPKIFGKKEYLAVQIKENKIVFYNLKKNDMILNTHYENNMVGEEENELPDLQNMNYLDDFKSNEIISNVKYQILFEDLKAVTFRYKILILLNLKIVKDRLNVKRGRNNQNLKFKFKNANTCRIFFETLRKRHKYYRDYNR